MNKPYSLIAACVITMVLYSCSKKTHPAETATADTKVVIAPDSVTAKKTIVRVKAKPLGSTPKVIVVNDAGAKKSIDGRLYYDLQGHRYWKNYKDGKYYLYNKSMNTDDAFKAPRGGS